MTDLSLQVLIAFVVLISATGIFLMVAAVSASLWPKALNREHLFWTAILMFVVFGLYTVVVGGF